MTDLGRPVRIFVHFLNTIGRRVAKSIVGIEKRETTDAEGRFLTVVVLRPPADESQQRQDFDAVRKDLVSRGELKHPTGEFLPAVIVGTIVVAEAIRGVLKGSFSGLSWVLAMFVFAIALLVATRWFRARRLDRANEESIAVAWLRRGCCPHCAYRLPPREAGMPLPRVRCTECGTIWRASVTPIQASDVRKAQPTGTIAH